MSVTQHLHVRHNAVEVLVRISTIRERWAGKHYFDGRVYLMWIIFVDGVTAQIVMSVDGEEIRVIASTLKRWWLSLFLKAEMD